MNPKQVREVPLFAGVGRRHRTTVAAAADEIDVAAGTTLIRKGQIAREFFVVLDGMAEVRSGATPLSTIGAGEFFGEMGVIDGPMRSATVVATTSMRLLVVGARELAALVDRFPTIGDRVRAAAAARAGATASATS